MPARATLSDADRRFIADQHLFFVATAPLKSDGLVNLSPKGLADTFVVIDDQTVAYLDFTGSGVETIAHVKENGRICVLFCAFAGPPAVLRLHGRAEVLEPADADFTTLLRDHFAPHVNRPGLRSILRVAVRRVATSCGFGVPLYDYAGQRTRLHEWAADKSPHALQAYQARHNRLSHDGLTGLTRRE